jgi:hypothetical protein
MRIRVTMYYKPWTGMTEKQKKMEGGATDRRGIALRSLEEFMTGSAEYVSLACDSRGGPPGNDRRFSVYGTKVRIPEVDQLVGKSVEFRLVDTGGHFLGRGKVVKSADAEPIDLCRSKPLFNHLRTEGLMTLEFIE